MEMEWRKANERITFFEPNGPQERLIKIIGEQKDIVGIFSAGNGTGKTTLAVNILGNAIWGSQNSFFDYPIFRNWPYPKRARFITDPKLVEEIGPFHSEIQKWWPKGKYEATKAGKNYFSQYKANDWVVDVMTYDQDISQFEGVTQGLILLDEPPPQPIWNASISRLRLGGMILVFMTPLTHAAYFFDSVVPRHPESIVYASMEENCKTHGIRGQLEHKQIEAMVAEMPADEVEARTQGKSMYLKGLIFKDFDRKVHVLKEPVTPPLNSTIYNVVDPAADKPFFAIWAWAHPNGDLYIIDEHPNEDFFKMHNCQWTREDYKRMYEAKEHGYDVIRVIDRHFADAMTAANKKTLREEMAEIGMNYERSYTASEEIDTGVMKVREYLKYDQTKPINSINRPKLYINPHCLNTIKGFERWSFDPKTGKYQEAYKDPMDVVRYLVMSNPSPVEPLPPYEPKRRYG